MIRDNKTHLERYNKTQKFLTRIMLFTSALYILTLLIKITLI